jgi:hypothetical protein
LPLDPGVIGFVTIHPSALLRMEDETDKQHAYHAFVADLRLAAKPIDPSIMTRRRSAAE